MAIKINHGNTSYVNVNKVKNVFGLELLIVYFNLDCLENEHMSQS